MRILIALWACCTFLVSNTSFTQECSPVTTTKPSGVILGNNSGGYRVFANHSTLYVESSDYYFSNNVPSVLNFSYDLASSSAANPQINGYTIEVFYKVAGNQNSRACSSTTPFTVSSTTPQSFYFSVPVNGLPVNTRFFIRLTLAVSNATNANIIGNSFRLESAATLLPVESTLPVTFLSLDASRQGVATVVTWKVAAEENVLNYDLEKSTDGKDFIKVGTITANHALSYSLADKQTLSLVYYRVKNNDKDGRYKYSSIIKVENGSGSFLKRAYPMPAKNEIYIQHEPVSAGTSIMLFTTDGRVVKQIVPQTGSMQTRIDLSAIASGLYIAKYMDGKGTIIVLKLVKE